MTPQERLIAYDRLQRDYIPALELEFAKATYSMHALKECAVKGSLKQLGAFILAADASESAQVKLLGAKKHAADIHPLSEAKFGT